ncbi:MAG: hypothetical protein V7L11_14645 [Nostoc sp.]|uniref:hypothetical protein n=1 Tax=Nostoc sp. TaxID=1180 RepID=UPI002FF645A4
MIQKDLGDAAFADGKSKVAKQTPLFALFEVSIYAALCEAYSSTRPTLTNATNSKTAGFLLL